MDEVKSLASRRIVVLGAGIVGLSTAYRLIELYEKANPTVNRLKNLDIEIISEKFLKDTTSDGAGGLFRPDDRFIPGVPKDLVRKWGLDSFEYFNKLLFSPDGGKAGVFQASGYQLFDDVRQDPSYSDYIYQFRHLDEEELAKFPRKFNLTSRGVKFNVKRIETQEKFLNENETYDIVINCLGFGAIQFCNDKKIVPIRGQMIRVRAPWIKHFYYTDDNCYIIPNVNTVCLGGTRQLNNFSLEIDSNDREGILSRCKELCPSIENAAIEWDWCGLRPHREPIRVEKEVWLHAKASKKTIIIHNYGHGGNGIALSRGTAVHAIELLLGQLADSNSPSDNDKPKSNL